MALKPFEKRYKDDVKRFNNGISDLKEEINMLKTLHETSNDTGLSTLESKIDKLLEKLDAHGASCQPKKQKTSTKKPESKKKVLDPQNQPIDETSTKDKVPKKGAKNTGKSPLQSTNASKVEKTLQNRRKPNKTVIKQEENGIGNTCARLKKKSLAADTVINDLESEFEREALELYNELNSSVIPLNREAIPPDIGGSDQRRMLLNTYSSSPNYSESDNEPENIGTDENRLVLRHANSNDGNQNVKKE